MSVQLSKPLYDALKRVEAARREKDKYSIAATVQLANRMGETALAEWINKHQQLYGMGFWYGFHVNSEYPGGGA